MQAGIFMAVLFTASYAPLALLTGWLHDVAKINPVTQILDGGAPGLRRRRDLGGHLAGPARPARPGAVLVGSALRGLRNANLERPLVSEVPVTVACPRHWYDPVSAV